MCINMVYRRSKKISAFHSVTISPKIDSKPPNYIPSYQTVTMMNSDRLILHADNHTTATENSVDQ